MLSHTFVFTDLMDVTPGELLAKVPARWAWFQYFRLLESDCYGREHDALNQEVQAIFNAHLATANILVDVPTLREHPLFAEIRYTCCLLNHRPPLGFDPQRIRGRRRPAELIRWGIRSTVEAPQPGGAATLWTVELALVDGILRNPKLRERLSSHDTAPVFEGADSSWPLPLPSGSGVTSLLSA